VISFRFEVEFGFDPERVERVVGFGQTAAALDGLCWPGQRFEDHAGGNEEGECRKGREFDASLPAADLLLTSGAAQTSERNRARFRRYGLNNSFELRGDLWR